MFWRIAAPAQPRRRSTPMLRVAVVAAFWFTCWIVGSALIGYLLGADQGGKANGVYFGAIYGAVLAAITAFAWPWILPGFIHDWMDGRR
jgi:hypothetical protein